MGKDALSSVGLAISVAALLEWQLFELSGSLLAGAPAGLEGTIFFACLALAGSLGLSLHAAGGPQAVGGATADRETASEDAISTERVKSDFLAKVSHEFRTPMNVIIGMTELALESTSDADRRRYLELVDRNAKALLHLIDEMLDISKLEAGQMDIALEPFDLYAVIEEVVDTMGLPGDEVEAICLVEPDVPPRIVGDGKRLRQVLVNLMGNALKFTERGEVTLSVSRAGDLVRFGVSDTGIGVSAEDQAKLFRPFVQADASITRRFGGAGLGLAISNSLVQLMGGEISIDSQLGVGSTFSFELAAALPEGAPAALQPLAPARGASLLVVDASERTRTNTRAILERRGYSVSVAGSVNEAMGKLYEPGRRFELMLVDRDLPGADGAAFAREVGAIPALASLTTILISSAGAPALEGDDGALHALKPMGAARLLQTVERAVAARAGSSARADSSAPRLPTTAPMSCGLHEDSGVYWGAEVHRALVAEDDPDNQQLLRGVLQGLGFSVDVVPDGAAAVDATASGRYDLLLMDVEMPVLDGVSAIREIREREARSGASRLPIVAVTARVGDAMRSRCLEAGADDYLTKPLDRLSFLEVVGGRVDRRPALLVVDDARDSRALLRILVGRCGDYRLFTARDGREAVALCKRRRFAGILMDMQMPRMNGYEAASAIRVLPGFSETPIIALTGHTGAAERQRCLDAGCSGYLSKPIRQADLETALEPITREEPTMLQIDPDLYDLIPFYLDERQADLRALRAAAAGGDATTVRRIAHNIRGTGAAYGFPRITDLGGALEDAARARDLRQIERLVDDLSDYLDTLADLPMGVA